MIKESILIQIESTPGLHPIADELIGMLVRIHANRGSKKTECGYNKEANDVAGLITNPSQLPCGAHYWYGVNSIISMCSMCENKPICNGINTVVIKQRQRIKCVLIK